MFLTTYSVGDLIS